MEDNCMILADSETTVCDQITKAFNLLRDSNKKYEWTGGWYYLEEWLPYMSSIQEMLSDYLTRMVKIIQSNENQLSDEDLLVTSSVIREIYNCILEKNRVIESKIARRDSYNEKLFEPVDIELYRKVGDIIQLTTLCGFLENRSPSDYFINLVQNQQSLSKFLGIGRQFRAGELSPGEVERCMPMVSEEHLKLILKLEEIRAKHLEEHHKLPTLNYADPVKEGNKRINEIVLMSKYLLQKNGYSRNWRQNLMNKVDELRPVIGKGGNTSEFREAMDFVEKTFVRLRTSYEKHQSRERLHSNSV